MQSLIKATKKTFYIKNYINRDRYKTYIKLSI